MRVTPEDILNGPVAPVLRRMTIPMIYGILSMMLFQTVDTIFVSMLGTKELAAITFTFPVTYTLMSFVLGITIAMSIIVGKAIGGGHRNQAARITTNAMLFGVIMVMFISLGGLASTDYLFTKLGAESSTLPLIHEYIDIWYVFAAFLVIPYLGNSSIRATGDTKWPSILMIGSGLVNVLLDPILIFGFGPIPAMGMRGAAYATAIAWIAGFAGSIWLLGYREKLIRFAWPDWQDFKFDTGNLIRLGAPISLANMFTPITIGALTAIVAGFGEPAVAAFGVGGRLESISMVVAFALTAALSPYMAQNIGANNGEKATSALLMALKFAVIFQLIMYALLAITSHWLGRIFSSEPEVLETINHYLWIMPLGAVFYAFVIVMNTACNASHRSVFTLIVTGARLVFFVVPLAFAGRHYFGLTGLFIGAVVGNVLTAGLSWWLYRKQLRPQLLATVAPTN